MSTECKFTFTNSPSVLLANPRLVCVRFKVNDSIEVRKLLWHGTNVAVVAAILNAGLRIMPHSGGLVGRGIYFASEHSKSAGYGRSKTLLKMSFN